MYLHYIHIYGFLVDAFVPEKNLVIEADGDYWHSLPRAIRNDARKDVVLGNLGFGIIRIKESDFRNGKYIEILSKILF